MYMYYMYSDWWNRSLYCCVHECRFSDDWLCPCPYEYVGETCALDSPCITDPCDVTGTASCTAVNETSRTCECNDGFSGEECVTGPCDTGPCDDAHTRDCEHFADGTFECECTATYEGDTCDTEKGMDSVLGKW